MNNIITQIQTSLLTISPKDILDVIIVAICIYLVLIFIKQTKSNFIFIAVIILFGLNFIAKELDLGLTRNIFEPLLTFFIAIFVVVFQPEIRKFFKWLSAGRKTSFKKALSLPEENAQTLVRASFEMAKKKIGAIIVLPGKYPLDDLIEGGFVLDGKISLPLILSIFDSSTPGHDGAILIEGSTVKMFGLHLPLAREFTEYSRVGTRHRAAAGITERTDSLAIVVSEERGEVSVSKDGKLKKIETPEELANIIHDFTDIEDDTAKSNKGLFNYFVVKNSGIKIIALILSIFFWFFIIQSAPIVKNSYNVPIEFKSLNEDMTISANSESTIKVTVTGLSNDIKTFAAENIRVTVDAQDFKIGSNNIIINEDNIKVPPYIKLDSFAPKKLNITTKTVK